MQCRIHLLVMKSYEHKNITDSGTICLTDTVHEKPGKPVPECLHFRILLELRMMEVVVTTGAIRCASSSQMSSATNTHSILQAGCPSCHPTNSVKTLKAKQRWLRRHNWRLLWVNIQVFTTKFLATCNPNKNSTCLPYCLAAWKLY